MKAKRTIPIIIKNDPDLQKTVIEFTKIKNILSPSCFNNGHPLRSFELQNKTYHLIKGILNSQMTCTCIRAVCAAYASAKSNGHPAKKPFQFKKKTALFLIGSRGRDASFHKSGKLSIWTVTERKKLTYSIPKTFQNYFNKAISYDSINIIFYNGKLRANLCLTLEVPDPIAASPVGIDLNETNTVVAVNKDGDVFFETGLKTKILNRRTRKTVVRLQRKLSSHKAENRNIHSVVRVLKRLGKKRKNRTLDFTRCTAKKLCTWAGPKSVLVFEDLNLKQQKKYDGKKKATHRKLSEFPHNLIRQCIVNRAELTGLGIDKVNPYRTSQIHAKCGLLGERNRHDFFCPHCKEHEHADINAAVNIRNRYTGLRASGVQSITPEALKVEANPAI